MGGRRGAEEAERRGCAEHGARDKQELLGGDLREGPFRDNQCPLEVMLPPEKAEACEGPGQLFCVDDGERAASREGARGLGKRRLNVDAVQCDVSVEEDDHQEWTFTLYGFDNSGKATREDMSSLMHTIYEVVDASVHRCSGSSKTLRVKLTVSPEPSSKRKDGPPAAQGGRTPTPTPARSGGPTAWMKTRSGGTTTWTWPESRTMHPSSDQGPPRRRPGRSPPPGPRTRRAGPARRSQTCTPPTIAAARGWPSSPCRPLSRCPGPWTCRPGRRAPSGRS